MRLSSEELEKVKEKYHVEELWSYSRLDTFHTSPYLFFLKYVKHEQPKKDIVSPYGIIGGAVHSVLEKYYNGEIKYGDMLEEFRTEYMTQIELFGLKFNNVDEKLNQSIAMKYKTDLEHFFENYKPVDTKHEMERFLVTEIQPGLVINGYADDIYKDSDGNYVINDFKTSSKSGFSGEKLKEKAAQVIIYAKALEQLGVPANKIKAQFNMLRYCNVDIIQKNGKSKVSTIERCQIGEKLQQKAAMWLKETELSEEEQNEILALMIQNNTIEHLPDNVKNKFDIKDCYIVIDDPLSMYDDLRKEIIDIVSEIDNRMHEWKEKHDDQVWWDDEESVEKNSYFLIQISEYSIEQHRPLAAYCDRLAKEEEEKRAAQDLLGVTKKTTAGDDDLSWLDELVGEG